MERAWWWIARLEFVVYAGADDMILKGRLWPTVESGPVTPSRIFVGSVPVHPLRHSPLPKSPLYERRNRMTRPIHLE